MPTRRLPLLPALFGLLWLSLAPRLGAQDRISRTQLATQAQGRSAIPDTVIPRARRANDLGLLRPSTPVAPVFLRFRLTAAQSADLSQLLDAQQNPASALYHRWLTPEEYAVRFGLSANDIATIRAWLASQGLTVTGIARSRTFITVSGDAAQLEVAFGTALHRLSLGGEEHFSNLSDPTVPTAIAGVVSGVTGLNDFRLRPHARTRVVARPDFTSATSGNHYIAPGDFYTIYDLNPLLNSSTTGAGVGIAVMGQTDISVTDVAAFRAASGLPANPPTVKLFFSDPGTSSPDLDEAQLDVEWAGAVAPGASILYVNSNDVVGVSLTQAVDNNLAPILTISYGDCESGFGASNIAILNQLFRQANAQGQTIVGPAGDTGATDCDYKVATASQGLAVDFPASSPSVTGVGGTMFNENGGTYFAATNGATAGSALSYIPEAVWNESAALGTLVAGGGGVSAYFTKPAFQVGKGVPNDFSRDVPDLSLNAGAAHDGYLFCSRGFCTNGFRNGTGGLDVVGGTSVSTPAFAGILALLEQKIKTSVGNANPVLYGLANSAFSPSVFHDLVTGTNATPCAAGTTDCPAGGTIGYAAAPGYDRASGWGSVDAFNLISDWLLVKPTGLGSAIGPNASFATVSISPNNVPAGTTVSLSVSVASATANAGSGPTGTVQMLVDNVAVGGPVALNAGAAASTLSTAGLGPGTHLLTAAYSGDGTFAGSKAAVTLNIVVSTAPDFTLTPSTGSTTVASGGMAPGIVFTAASANGFSGAVTFLASSVTSGLAATPSFNINPVTVTATASGSTVLTLLAYRTQGAVQPGWPGRASAASKLTGLAFAGCLLLAIPGVRRRRWSSLWMVLLAFGLGGMAGCGGQNSGVTPAPAVTNTPPGTYTVLVSASATTAAGVVTHNSTVTLVVQ